jgi:hypothetical protein
MNRLVRKKLSNVENRSMNKIIREHYPVSKLPSDLREGLDPSSEVKVTVEKEETPPHTVMTLEDILAARKPPYRTAAEIDADLRRGREDADA